MRIDWLNDIDFIQEIEGKKDAFLNFRIKDT